MTEQERNTTLFDIKTWEFTQAMQCHGCYGEYAYYLTEGWVMWPDIGYDAEHSYLLN